jgi:hypothetical protein
MPSVINLVVDPSEDILDRVGGLNALRHLLKVVEIKVHLLTPSPSGESIRYDDAELQDCEAFRCCCSSYAYT